MTTTVEISKRLVLINSASSVVAKVLNVGVLLWLYQHLLRRISPEEYALYPVIVGFMEFAPLFTVILKGGLGRYVVEAYAKGDEQRVTQITSTMFPVLLAAAAPVLVVGGLFAWNVDRILTVAPERVWDARLMMGLMVASVAIRLPLAPFAVGLYVRQKFVWSNLIRVSSQFLRVALLFALLFGVSTRVLWVVVATVSARLCELIVTQVISRRLVPALKFRLREVRWTLAKEVMSFGVWNFLARLGRTIYDAGDAIMLNKLATALDVSCFHIGALIQRHVLEAWTVVAAPLLPAMTAMHAKGKKESLRTTFLRGSKYALWMVMPIALPAAVFRHELVTLYVGEQYAEAATVMGLLVLPLIMTISHAMMWMIAHVTAQIRAYACRSMLIQLLNVALTLYFVGALQKGAVGAALSTFIVFGLGIPLLIWPLGLRLADVRFGVWFWDALLPGSLPGLASLVAWIAMESLLCPTTWIALAACGAIGLVCYALALVPLCLGRYERRAIERLVTSARCRLSVRR